MALRLPGRGRPTQRRLAEPPQDAVVVAAPEVFTGTTIEPEEGAASRIDDASDVDPNIKRYGMVGGPGGAGGFGGAGTK